MATHPFEGLTSLHHEAPRPVNFEKNGYRVETMGVMLGSYISPYEAQTQQA
jgi:hypothetical protein